MCFGRFASLTVRRSRGRFALTLICLAGTGCTSGNSAPNAAGTSRTATATKPAAYSVRLSADAQAEMTI